MHKLNNNGDQITPCDMHAETGYMLDEPDGLMYLLEKYDQNCLSILPCQPMRLRCS